MNAKKYPHFLFWFIGKLSFSKTKKIILILFSHNSPGTSSNGMKINEFPVTKMQTHQLQYQSRGQSDDCITSPHQRRRWGWWQVITNDPKKMVQRPLFRKQKKTPQGLFWNCWTLPLKKQNPPQKKNCKTFGQRHLDMSVCGMEPSPRWTKFPGKEELISI